MSVTTSQDELVWKALGSQTRRKILDILREGPETTGGIAENFPNLSRYAVMQHLGVLVDAGLVLVHREGRVRWNSLNVVPIQRIYERWLTEYHAMWAGHMLDIKRRVEATTHERTTKETHR